MTFLDALYGCQYAELAAQGKDGNKGRFNANLFLSAFVILVFFAVLMIMFFCIPGFESLCNNFLVGIFGHQSGKTAGKLLALPLVALIYFVISRTIGSENNFQRRVETFQQLPIEIQKRANRKILIPFLLMVLVVTVMAFLALKR